jgi:O-antigen/teichoic acid export membrane protein
MRLQPQWWRGQWVLASGANFVQLAAGVASGVMLGRSLTPDLRGQVAAITLWAGLAGTVAEGGLGFAVSHYSGCAPASRSTLWVTAVVGGMVLGSVAALVTGLALPSGIAGTLALSLGMLTIPVTLVSGHQSYLLLGAGSLPWFNGVRLLAAGLYTILVAVCFVWRVESPAFFIGAQLISQCAGALAGALAIRSLLRHPEPGSSTVTLGEVAQYGGRAWMSSVMAQLSMRADQLTLSLFGSSQALGIYAIASSTASMSAPLYHALSAHLAASGASAPGQESLERRTQIARSHMRFSAWLGCLMAAATGAAAFAIVPLLFGSRYHAAELPAAILCIAAAIGGQNIVMGAAQRLVGRPGAPGYAEMSAALVGFVAVPLFYVRFGLAGAAAGSAVAMTAGLVTHVLLFQRSLKAPALPTVSAASLTA